MLVKWGWQGELCCGDAAIRCDKAAISCEDSGKWGGISH